MGPNEIGTSSGQKKWWLWGCASGITLCAVLAYAQWFFWGYVPISTLPVKRESVKCATNNPLWPMTMEMPFRQFPAFSPDRKYYIDLSNVYYRDAEEVRLYEANTGHFLGSYSYLELYIYCWAQDSSGVYLTDSAPGGSFDIDPDLPLGIGVDKKVLVPCRSSLESVSLLPRLYWEIRCALPGSEHSLFAVWFPLVVMIGGGIAGVRLLLWLWRRWVRPWWYGE